MNGSEVFIIIGSMAACFIMGLVVMMFLGGRLGMNYLLVKASRGKKILLMVKTPFGWRSLIGKKDQNLIKWKYDKKDQVTVVDEEASVGRFMRVDIAYIDSQKPEAVLALVPGAFYPKNFDHEVFNNILIRAITRPSADGVEGLEKKVMIILLLVVLIGIGLLFTYFKLSTVAKALATGGHVI